MEFDWWNTIQAYEILPNVHVMQWLGMFWLDFGHCFHGIWWNVSCLVCELCLKEWKNMFSLKMNQIMRTFYIPINLDLNWRGFCEMSTELLVNVILCAWPPDYMTSFTRKQYPNAVIGSRYLMLWYDWCEIHTQM